MVFTVQYHLYGSSKFGYNARCDWPVVGAGFSHNALAHGYCRRCQCRLAGKTRQKEPYNKLIIIAESVFFKELWEGGMAGSKYFF